MPTMEQLRDMASTSFHCRVVASFQFVGFSYVDHLDFKQHVIAGSPQEAALIAVERHGIKASDYFDGVGDSDSERICATVTVWNSKRAEFTFGVEGFIEFSLDHISMDGILEIETHVQITETSIDDNAPLLAVAAFAS